MTEPTNLHALLGDRYDDVIDRAMAAPKFYATRQYTIRDRVADTLAAVLPGLLAEAWDEGYEAAAGDFHDDEFGLPGDRTPNPYRTEETR